MLCKESIALFLFVVVSFHTPVESVLCRDTRITANLSDPDTRSTVFGTVLRKLLRSSIMPRWSPLGDEVVDYVFQLYNETDSPLMKAQLQSLTLLSGISVFWAMRFDFCILAEVLNATALYVREGNNRAILPIIDPLAFNIAGDCKEQTRWILNEMGCKKLPDVPCYNGTKCPDRGFIYPVKEILDTYGKYVPCRYRGYVLELYESHKSEDKTLAIIMTQALATLSLAIDNLFPVATRLEINDLLADPSEKICCCRARRERLLQICQSLSDTDVNPLRGIFSTECPPEAAYQK